MKKILPIIVLLLASSFVPSYAEDGKYLAFAFQSQIDRRLEVSQEAQARYAQLLDARAAFKRSHFIGASSASSGMRGEARTWWSFTPERKRRIAASRQ